MRSSGARRRADAVRRRLIDRSRAAREGRRFHAFYRGCCDARAGRDANPYPAASEEAACWDKGRRYAEDTP
ncbi:MAG: hypothetical protein ACP5HU_10240 [Phycisphaerae bacterium]